MSDRSSTSLDRWRAHPRCAGAAPWPARYWGPEALDPSAWSEFAARLDPSAEIAALLSALAGARGGAGPRRVVDVGGGTGLLTRAIAARFGACAVIEPSAAQVAALPPGLAVVRGRGEALPIADRSVDAAIATWVLQYTADPHAVVDELARVVGDRGRVVIAQAAPANDLVAIYNAEAAAVELPAAHHGWLLAHAAARLEDAGFAVALDEVAIPLAVSADEVTPVAALLARLHFATHPRRDAIAAAGAPVIAAALARSPGALRDDAVLLIATRR